MAIIQDGATVREAVAVFAGRSDLHGAVDALLRAGFKQSEVSLMASLDTVSDRLGHRIARIDETEDDPRVPRRVYVEPDVDAEARGWLVGGLTYLGAAAAVGGIAASGGTLAGAIVAAGLAGGSGALLGAALARFVGERRAEELRAQLAAGGLVLWVRTLDADREQRALAILGEHNGRDVHVHEFPAAA
jgi:hypothetical protein